MSRVLVVDDSVFQRNQVTKALKAAGHDTVEAVNGQAALDWLVEDSADLIFLDLLMPEVDGFGVLEKLKERKNRTPIVVLTADIQESQREKCFALGASDFLNKPTKADELVRVASELLSQHEAEGEERELSDFEVDALRELINIGVGKAASVLNEMLDTHVDLRVPDVKLYSRSSFDEWVSHLPDETYSAVKLGFDGILAGSASLVFVSKNASKLVGLLTGDAQEEMDSLMASTLTEVGNIVVNGVMGSIANTVRQTISYSVPVYTRDRFENLVQVTPGAQVQFIVADTTFQIQEHEISGEMILLFELDAFQALLRELV